MSNEELPEEIDEETESVVEELENMDIIDLLRVFSAVLEELEESGQHLVKVAPLLEEAATEIEYLRQHAIEDITVYGDSEEEVLIHIAGDDIYPAVQEAIEMWINKVLSEKYEDRQIDK